MSTDQGREAFEAAISAEEKLKLLEEMEEESGFEAKHLGSEYEKLAKQYHSEGKFPEKVLYFATKALYAYLDVEKSSKGCKVRRLSIASTLYLLGAVCRELKRYDESLKYLKWCKRNVVALQEEGEDNSGFDAEGLSVLDVKTEFELLEVKIAMGKIEETPVHMEKILEIKKKTLEEGSLELGKAYRKACEVYLSVLRMEEACMFCVKALEIYEKHFGGDSVEVVEIREHLGTLYFASEEFEKALEQSQLLQSVFKKMGMSSKLLEIQVDESLLLTALGRGEEAVGALTAVISRGDLEPGLRAKALIYMAVANFKMEKFDDAKKDLKIGQKFLEELDANSVSPHSIATRFLEVSTLYQEMDDSENAIHFARRLLAIPELPLQDLVKGSARLALLLVRYGKAQQGIFYSELENVMNKLENNVGPEHSGLGTAFERLGRAYIDSKRDLGAKYLEYAKSIMDVSLGPEHMKSLNTNGALALTYAKLGRFTQAVDIQEKVVEALRGRGPSDRLDEAVGVLDMIMSMKAGFEDILGNSPGFGVSYLETETEQDSGEGAAGGDDAVFDAGGDLADDDFILDLNDDEFFQQMVNFNDAMDAAGIDELFPLPPLIQPYRICVLVFNHIRQPPGIDHVYDAFHGLNLHQHADFGGLISDIIVTQLSLPIWCAYHPLPDPPGYVRDALMIFPEVMALGYDENAINHLMPGQFPLGRQGRIGGPFGIGTGLYPSVQNHPYMTLVVELANGHLTPLSHFFADPYQVFIANEIVNTFWIVIWGQAH